MCNEEVGDDGGRNQDASRVAGSPDGCDCQKSMVVCCLNVGRDESQ